MSTIAFDSDWYTRDSSDSNTAVRPINPMFSTPSSVLTTGEIFRSTDSLSKKAERILGLNGMSRFNEFRRYPKGWDEGKGKELSTRSTAVLEAFLQAFGDFNDQPSLFFTRDGNLQMGWEDKAGHAIEIEFFPERVEYYIEQLEEEDSSAIDRKSLIELVHKLKTI